METMNIEKAINLVFNIVDKAVEAVDPEGPGGAKVTLTEGFGIGISLIGFVPAITAIAQLTQDWQTRDEVKKQAWLNAFKERFDLPDDEMEELVERVVESLLTLDDALSNLNAVSIK